MLLAGFVEGAVLGHFHWKVFLSKFPNLPKREWLYYTIQVGVLGWLLGMLPSLFLNPNSIHAKTSPNHVNFSDPLIFASLSIFLGLVLRAIFGLFQWFSLKNMLSKPINGLLPMH